MTRHMQTALRGPVIAGVLLLFIGTGCDKHEFEPPDRAERVAQADSIYTPASFDSIQWLSEEERLQTGNEVYARKCDKCHGPTGEGGTEYAAAQQIAVPALTRADWELGDDRDAVRRRVFTGHERGMPTWGVANLTPREIDAVTAYILERLRKEAASS